MSEWPRYRSHRVVSATPIIRIESKDDGSLPLLFVDPSNGREPFEPFFPSEPEMARRAKILDFAMKYDDGYRSLCPKRQFEDGYSPYGGI